MKKKAAIVTIIITSAIIWVLTALAVGLNGTQSLAFTDVIQEAGSGVTYVKNSKSPVTFFKPAIPFNVDPVMTIDHYFRYLFIFKQLRQNIHSSYGIKYFRLKDQFFFERHIH